MTAAEQSHLSPSRLDAVRRNRDAFRDALALVLRTGEPDGDRRSEYPAARKAMVEAAVEAAQDVAWLVAEVDRLYAELAAVQRAHELAATDLDTLTVVEAEANRAAVDVLDASTPEGLLNRGIRSVEIYRNYGLPGQRTRVLEYLWAVDVRLLADALLLAMERLAVPGRVGSLDGLRYDLAEAMFDAAHENCDDETGCTGGGKPYWLEYVDNVLMPAVREHAVPAESR